MGLPGPPWWVWPGPIPSSPTARQWGSESLSPRICAMFVWLFEACGASVSFPLPLPSPRREKRTEFCWSESGRASNQDTQNITRSLTLPWRKMAQGQEYHIPESADPSGSCLHPSLPCREQEAGTCTVGDFTTYSPIPEPGRHQAQTTPTCSLGSQQARGCSRTPDRLPA